MSGLVGFTGTKKGMTREQSYQFTNLIRQAVTDEATEFHHGDCIGSDDEADGIVYTLTALKRHIHPPTDPKFRAYCDRRRPGAIIYPPMMYLARDKQIANTAQLLIATPKTAAEQRRSGTWSTIRYARARQGQVLRITIVRINPDGTLEYE